MLQPKRVKYRKPYLGRFKGISTSNKVLFGDFGLQSLGASLITSRQIEATRRVLTRHVRKKGKLWIRIFPDKAITARPSESRMGQGKGKVSFWSFKVKPGTIIIEITGLDKERSFKVLKLASYKLPVKVKAVDKKYNFYEGFEVPELDEYKQQQSECCSSPVPSPNEDVESKDHKLD